MIQDNFFRELIVDNFAGGGGASVGIELATGRPVVTALAAIEGHEDHLAKSIAYAGAPLIDQKAEVNSNVLDQ